MTTMTKVKKSFKELNKLKSYEERFNYLKLTGVVGQDTFGFDRYLNQSFYRSREWKRIRDQVIVRDNGNDMGLEGYPIGKPIMIHHINPVTLEDLEEGNPIVFDLDNLVCCSKETHNAIHYGSKSYPSCKAEVERKPNDTCPWRL